MRRKNLNVSPGKNTPIPAGRCWWFHEVWLVVDEEERGKDREFADEHQNGGGG